MIECAVCKSKKFFKIKEISVEALKEKWLKDFSMKPFESFEEEKIVKYNCLECDCFFYNPTIVGDDIFYKSLSESTIWYYEEDKPEFQLAIDVIKKYKPVSIAEFGCGSGAFLSKLLNISNDVSGIEINPDGIKKCRDKGIKVLEKFDKKYDAIFSFQVFEHLDNLQKIFEECIKNLNSGGILFIAVANPESFIKDIDLNILDLPPHHQLGLTKKTFEYLAQHYSLKIQDYWTESLRFIHVPWYINEIINKEKTITPLKGIKQKLVNKIKDIFNYFNVSRLQSDIKLFKRHKIIGHTHSVLFIKE